MEQHSNDTAYLSYAIKAFVIAAPTPLSDPIKA